MKGLIAFIAVLFIMPLGHAVTILALKPSEHTQLMIAAGGVLFSFIILYLTCFIKSPAWKTFTGMITGVVLWASLVEIGVKAGAKAAGINENIAMELTLAVLIPLIFYLLFNNYIKCNLFISLRKLLHIKPDNRDEIIINEWGPRAAFKIFSLIWIGHLLLFFAFDERFFGPQGLFCKGLFFVCLIGGTYLFYRLLKSEQLDFAFRYAIPTVIVIWSCIETMVKWKVFTEPWITLNPVFMSFVVIAFTATLFFAVKIERKKKSA